MAIHHFSARAVQRSKGRNMVQVAAVRSGTPLYDAMCGRTRRPVGPRIAELKNGAAAGVKTPHRRCDPCGDATKRSTGTVAAPVLRRRLRQCIRDRSSGRAERGRRIRPHAVSVELAGACSDESVSNISRLPLLLILSGAILLAESEG